MHHKMSAIPALKLNTGASIPAIGLGAFDPDIRLGGSEKWFLTAFEAGYRHIDTAQLYGGNPRVYSVRRSMCVYTEWLISCPQRWHHGGKYVARSFEDSLRNLGLDYVDLYLMHFPLSVEYPSGYDTPSTFEGIVKDLKLVDTPTFNDTWAEMEKIHASGRARAIGVSNFSIKTLEQLFKTAKIVPAVNQVEIHPYLAQTELIDYCRKKGIMVTAYSPTGHEKVRSDPTIVALANKYGVTPTQIILAWHVARGISAVPKSANPDRQKENLTLPTLSAEDVAKVTALDRNERIVNKLGPDGKLHGWTAEQYGW
ncbi:NADP-dependent oxidoreductase domain-containing protein [Mycena vulgaris]|nr:NADP-dependent oxidoreductase domain-containing protein [Mycena vulgaris]